MVSAITERPYTFLRWLTGTLPGRKPLRRTLSLRSIRRASALASRSDAGTLIWNSCFNPSARVSVTCMASIYFPLGPANAATLSVWSTHGVKACGGGSAAPILQGKLPLRKWVPPVSSCKRCQRLVRAEGLEPPQLSSLEPKSSASTSSATPARIASLSGRDAAGGGLITRAHRFAAKKWPRPSLPGEPGVTGHIRQNMVRIDAMAERIFPLDRRKLIAGLGAAVLSPAMPSTATAQGPRPSIALRAKAEIIALRPGAPETPIWSLAAATPDRDIGLKRGDAVEITLLNDLPLPIVLNWHGLEGVPATEPLGARAPLPPGAKESLVIPVRHAGTLMYDLRLLGDGQVRPSPARALIVREGEPVAVDRDEIFLFEDWRLRADGSAIAPGIDPADTVPLLTI